MADDQFKTAQTYALEIVRLQHEQDALELQIKKLEEIKEELTKRGIDTEAALLDCLPATCRKTYICQEFAVTVVKAIGDPSKVFVTEAIGG